jgi:hypothetical protein
MPRGRPLFRSAPISRPRRVVRPGVVAARRRLIDKYALGNVFRSQAWPGRRQRSGRDGKPGPNWTSGVHSQRAGDGCRFNARNCWNNFSRSVSESLLSPPELVRDRKSLNRACVAALAVRAEVCFVSQSCADCSRIQPGTSASSCTSRHFGWRGGCWNWSNLLKKPFTKRFTLKFPRRD